MALKTFVKINSITNLTDARYGSGMYVNLLGFDLNPSSGNYTSPELFKEITGWVSGVAFVGEFSHQFHPNILEILKEYPAITWIEYDQIEQLTMLSEKGYSLIYRMPVEEIGNLEPEVVKGISEAGIFLHLVSREELLSSDVLAMVYNLAKNCKVILGTGIDAENVLQLVENSGIYGISLSGGVELKPGLKDLDQLAEILEKLEIED